MILNTKELGQVFTSRDIVQKMISLIKNQNTILEPSCGNGSFASEITKLFNLNQFKKPVFIELDSKQIFDPLNQNNQKYILNLDFFDYSLDNKFDTIIGNPPYVRYQDILVSTKEKIKPYMDIFDLRTNLYQLFIYKSILHLNKHGELIFIVPRDFLKATSSIKLNNFIYEQGTITDFFDLGDQKIFHNATPNVVIFRFQKGNFNRKTNQNLFFNNFNGQLVFTKKEYTIPFNQLFFVKVGAASGSDHIFKNEKGNVQFVTSDTRKTNKIQTFIYKEQNNLLLPYKQELLNRKIKKFNENNWWEWGRNCFESELPRIYVNQKTRIKNPFFLNDSKYFLGSVLAIFPKKYNIEIIKKMSKNDIQKELNNYKDFLNSVDWQDLGFVCDGRFIFNQKALENIFLTDTMK